MFRPCLLTLLLLTTASSVAPVSVRAQSDEARGAHEQGVKLFKEEKFREAAAAFRKAYALKPAWKLLYNVGQSEAAAKRYELALEAFESYLTQGGDEVPEDRREPVAAEIRRLQGLVGVLELDAPQGLEVRLDGLVRATLPLAGPLRVAAGKHQLALIKGGAVVHEQEIQIASSMTTRIAWQPKSETPAPPAIAPSAAPTPTASATEPAPLLAQKQGRSRVLAIVGWTAVGVGAAAAIGGLALGGVALAKDKTAYAACKGPDGGCETTDQLDEAKKIKKNAKSLARGSDILLPVGASLAVVGAVLVIIDWRLGKKSEHNMALVPVLDGRALGFGLAGRF